MLKMRDDFMSTDFTPDTNGINSASIQSLSNKYLIYFKLWSLYLKQNNQTNTHSLATLLGTPC